MDFLLLDLRFGFGLYLVVQLIAIARVRGKDRSFVALPLPVMLAVLGWTMYARSTDGNLWPIIMIFASPPATVAVLVLWWASWREGRAAPGESR